MTDRHKHVCDFVFDPETWEGTYREWSGPILVYETTAHLTDIPSLLFMSGYGEADDDAANLARRQMRVVESNDVHPIPGGRFEP